PRFLRLRQPAQRRREIAMLREIARVGLQSARVGLAAQDARVGVRDDALREVLKKRAIQALAVHGVPPSLPDRSPLRVPAAACLRSAGRGMPATSAGSLRAGSA